MGPSRVEPLYGEILIAQYGPLFGVQVWCPDVLISYVVQVPKMVCFFEVTFENSLRFPLHPFIKRVLQHFNVCPSQLSPNFWGILVRLLVVFRDRGLGVPSIALLVKPRENPIFLKNGKMVILVKIRKFSRSWKTKQTSLLESSREI